jgi:hypothetical protein
MAAPVRTVVAVTGSKAAEWKVPGRRRSATEIMTGRMVPGYVRPGPRHRRGGHDEMPKAPEHQQRHHQRHPSTSIAHHETIAAATCSAPTSPGACSAASHPTTASSAR